MRINVTISKIVFDKKGFISDTFDSLRQKMLEAAEQFCLVALPAITVYTGMARGSFLNMLQLLEKNKLGGAVKPLIPTTAQRRMPNGRNYIKYYHGGKSYNKEPTTAKKFSTSRGQIINRSGDKLTFKYQIDISYFGFMDEFSPFTKGPWQSIRRGKEAFNRHLQGYKPDHVTKYLTITTHSSVNDGEGNSKSVRTQKMVK